MPRRPSPSPAPSPHRDFRLHRRTPPAADARATTDSRGHLPVRILTLPSPLRLRGHGRRDVTAGNLRQQVSAAAAVLLHRLHGRASRTGSPAPRSSSSPYTDC